MKYSMEFISFIFFTGFWVISACEAQTQTERPNIVWLVTEDNSKVFLKLYDKDGVRMPNIEALAKEGIVFENAFSNAPVCSVARSTIISGCYAPRIGAQYHRAMKLAPMPDGLKMFPYYLRKAGYYTTNNAKEDYNLKKSVQVWDESSKEATYKNRKPGQPFFHVQNYATTHEGKLHFSKEEMKENPTKILPKEVPINPFHPDTPVFRYTNAYYRDLHAKVDKQMGKFIEELEKDGLMENTIIFYYGDHGGVLPRSKGYIYESGLDVPFVVYIPKKWKNLTSMKTGSRTDTFIEFIDLAPTVLNLAGIEVPSQMDGKPFLGNGIDEKELKSHNTTFSYADRFDEKYDFVRAIRKGKYKYIRNYQPFNIDALFNFYRYKMLAYKEWKQLYDAGKLNKIQRQFFETRQPEALYDLEKDPYETHNLINDSSYETVLKDLRYSLKEKVTSMPDLSFYPEPYLLENGLGNPVAFGQKNKSDIAELVDIADLSLNLFNKSKNNIRKALESKDPWKRYWSLIVCSSFGDKASIFYKKANKMLKQDNENLVRIRAAEFLGLNHQPVNSALFLDILKEAKTESEANLILNSIASLKMIKPNFQISIPSSLFPHKWVDEEGDLVNRRIEFINNTMEELKKP